MPTIHYPSNLTLAEPDIHTVFMGLFLFRFIDRASLEVKQITATTIEQAKAVLGGDLVFAARFRPNNNFRTVGAVTCHTKLN